MTAKIIAKGENKNLNSRCTVSEDTFCFERKRAETRQATEKPGSENVTLVPVPDEPIHFQHCQTRSCAINCKRIDVRDAVNELTTKGETGPEALGSNAINCKSFGFAYAAVAANTRKAHAGDLGHFLAWGGTLPSSVDEVVAYLTDHAGVLSLATLKRRLASLSVAHELAQAANPVCHPLVQATVRGIARQLGGLQRRAAPLLIEDLKEIMACLTGSVKDTRDRALLLVDFAGAFRRSELVAFNRQDIIRVREGIVLTLRRSKTDQEGIGRPVAIPFARGRICAVQALDDWLALLPDAQDPLFRPVSKSGYIHGSRLSDRAISDIIKGHVASIGHDPGLYSGHSLRSGLATSAARAGVSSWKIRAQTGHKSDAMLERYIRDGELFIDNAAGALL